MNFKHNYIILIFICSYSLLNTSWAQHSLISKKIDNKSLPSGMVYKGNFKDAIEWSDKLGKHIVILSETGKYFNPSIKHDNEGVDADLFAYHYQINDSAILVWKIHDFIMDCIVDLEAIFIKNTFQITDLDHDGIAEIWIMYKTICHGDVSPYNMKIIMYQGNHKYAMRGHNKIELSSKEFIGGEYKFDSMFNVASKEFREFAIRLWNKNIMQEW